jgi:hypothetical protein
VRNCKSRRHIEHIGIQEQPAFQSDGFEADFGVPQVLRSEVALGGCDAAAQIEAASFIATRYRHIGAGLFAQLTRQ